MRRHRAFVAAHAGRVLLLRCASKSQNFCNEFLHFSPNLRESDAERAQPRCHTPRRLDRALRRRRTFLCTASDASAHTFCENENRKAFKKFGNLKNSRVVDANFERLRRQPRAFSKPNAPSTRSRNAPMSFVRRGARRPSFVGALRCHIGY